MRSEKLAVMPALWATYGERMRDESLNLNHSKFHGEKVAGTLIECTFPEFDAVAEFLGFQGGCRSRQFKTPFIHISEICE
jgi:hypothetical protein